MEFCLTTQVFGSPQTSFTPIAAAPVKKGKVGQGRGLNKRNKRARTPQNITGDDVKMQGEEHTTEESVADKFADLSDAMVGFVQSILLTAPFLSTRTHLRASSWRIF